MILFQSVAMDENSGKKRQEKMYGEGKRQENNYIHVLFLHSSKYRGKAEMEEAGYLGGFIRGGSLL